MTSADGHARSSGPLAAHLALLAGLLVAAALWVGAHGQVSVDEGVAVVQAQLLDEHGTWAMPHDLEVIDPDGDAFPLRHATRTDDGYVPFAKHPLYPVVLAAAHAVAGVTGLVALSIAGAVGAAAAAAVLARRLDPRLATPALYATGLGSPLLFDSSLVIAHTLGAAAVGLAAVGFVRHHESGERVGPWLAPAALGVALVVLLRGEGPLLVAALVLVAAAVAARQRARAWAVTAMVAGGAGAMAFAIERVWVASILGDGVDLPGAPGDGSSWLADRVEGAVTVLVRPAYGDGGEVGLLVAGVAALAIAAFALRRGDPDRLVVGLVGASGALVTLWALADPGSAVPGLLMAFPALWFGLAVGRWWEHPTATALAATAGLFALGVLAMQYRQGGGFEWGARYLALALPLLVPVALLGMLRGLEHRPRPAVTGVVAGLGLVTLALSATALRVERQLTDRAHHFGERLEATAAPSRLATDPGDERPILVSAEFALPQLAWPQLAGNRWLRLREDGPVEADGIDPRIQALYDAGVDRFTFVTRDLDRDRPLLGRGRVVTTERAAGFELVVVAAP